MAKVFPSIEKILKMKVPPTEGELSLLNFLNNTLDDSFEVYFNPYMNGDRPDIVIVRKRHGVLIIEVKDWDLDAYQLDERKHWILKNDPSTKLKSPIDQVLKYKENLYTLHLDDLYEKRIKDYRFMNVISCAVYFHNATQDAVEEFMVNPYISDKKYQTFLSKNIILLGRDKLQQQAFNQILWKIYMISNNDSQLFTDSLYESISHFLLPTTHQKEDGKYIKYLKKQAELIFKNDRKEFVVEGVEGSGKTTVLARRAVEEYKRVKERNGEDYTPQILILTYNITLINFIHDKINQIQEEFEWTSFTILNYHHFINNQLNNLGIPVVLPNNDIKNQDESRNRKLTPEESKLLDILYYSNKNLFLEKKNLIREMNLDYDAILVDEMQDYKKKWFEILKETFLKDDGDYLLFGDEKQNIYGNPLLAKKVETNIPYRRTKLTQSLRAGTIIEKLVEVFQKQLYSDKYEIDEFQKPDDGVLMFQPSGSIKYKFLENDFITSIYDIVAKLRNIEEYKDIATDDITILSFNVDVLRQLEAFYRHKTGEKSMTMFETKETVIYVNFKREWLLHKRGEKNESKFFDVEMTSRLISLMQGRDDEDKLKKLSTLIVLYDLNKVYNDSLHNQFDYQCRKLRCEKDKILSILDQNYLKLRNYLGEIMKKDYEGIREHKKARFYMHPGYMKISTIHSFKGWESKLVVLIIDSYAPNDKAIDEIVYTGITRCKEHLYIINMKNFNYDKKITSILNNI